jgi:signal transduction histidine kinase
MAFASASAIADGQASVDEAKAMAIKAADYLKSVGAEKAFQEFDAKDGPWHDRDLYVMVESNQNIMVAHGTNPGLIGKNVADLKDPDGKSISRDVQAISASGWVNFRWLNPITKRIEPKTSYWIRTGDYLVGVGAYVKSP